MYIYVLFLHSDSYRRNIKANIEDDTQSFSITWNKIVQA